MLSRPTLRFRFVCIDSYMEGQYFWASKLLHLNECQELDRRAYRNSLLSCQYVFSRLLLKTMLLDFGRFDIQALNIRTASSGEPLVFDSDQPVKDVCVSISHCKSFIFVAACVSYRCGVDVQYISGVDWPLVIRFMGWTHHVESWMHEFSGLIPQSKLTLEVGSSLLWSAYESWRKLTGCTYDSCEFVWQRLILVSVDPATSFCIFRMELAQDCLFSQTDLILSLRSYEVLAVAANLI